MRRLSGLLAILALFRFSVGGAVPQCVDPGDAAATHAGHGSTLATAPDAGGADQSDPACDHSQESGCAAMAACVPVLPSAGTVLQTGIVSPERVTIAVSDARIFPDRTPDPPPPRA
jgi:hypothetical protein